MITLDFLGKLISKIIMAKYKGLLVNVISSWTPRVCGIGSFSQDTVDAIATYEDTIKQIKVHPIDKTGLKYIYPIKEKHVIRQLDTSSWENAANMIIERSKRRWIEDGLKSITVFEHEYGLDGTGIDNNYNLVGRILKKEGIPTVGVLHTILQTPNKHQKEILQEMGENCSILVTLSPSGIDMLKDIYGIENVTYIPHGIPNIDKDISKQDRKRQFGLEDRILIGTAGLVSQGKGLNYGISAFYEFLKMIEPGFRKNFVYLISGQTHPEGLEYDGGRDHHREELWSLCQEKNLNPIEIRNENLNRDKKLNIDKNQVIFLNTHLGDNALLELIASEDVGLMPYTNPQQISSGITFFHAGIGTPSVSTSTICAKDLYSNNKGEVFHINKLNELEKIPEKKLSDKDKKFLREVSGVITDIGDIEQMAKGIKYVLENSQKIEANILKKGYSMSWRPVIGAEYVSLFTSLVSDKKINICQIPFIK